MSDTNSQQPSPAKGRGRGRGRGSGRSMTSRAGVRKPNPTGRRGRQKTYETSRAQAAHERERELKNAYAAVANAMRPALQDLADRDLDLLKEKFDAHKEVDAYQEIVAFLGQRLKDRQSELDLRLNADLTTHAHEWQAKQTYLAESFRNRWDDLIEDFYDAQLRRLGTLEQLHHNREPVDKIDASYNFRDISDEEAAEVGPYRLVRDGVEIPYPQLLSEPLHDAQKPRAARTPIKRKAGDHHSEDHPTPKRLASVVDEKAGVNSHIPRHIGGLLSAVAPPEDPATPGSKLPSPSPDSPTPTGEPEVSDLRSSLRPRPSARLNESPESDSEPMPPLPNGASEPDAYGVRLINKRARAGDAPNNRIMIPSVIEFEDHEIGFRDSTNDKGRGATKAKRGRFLNTPNTAHMFFDRTLCSQDATQYADGDLDQETIRRHKLHPTYGMFLATSVNEQEPSRPFESGWKPTVFVSPSGEVLHTSRSIRASKAEDAFVKATLKDLTRRFMEAESMNEEDLHSPEAKQLLEERERKRLELEHQEDESREQQDRELAVHNMQALLDACVSSDAQEAKEERKAKEMREAQVAAQAQIASPVVSRSTATSSRRYDAVRDVLTSPEPPQIAPAQADTSGLHLVADLALGLMPIEPQVDPPIELQVEPHQIQMQMPEPVHPQQLRDPQDLIQPDERMDYTAYPEPPSQMTQAQQEQMHMHPQLALPEYFMGREQVYAQQPLAPYHDHQAPPPSLAPPEAFAYRDPGQPQERGGTAFQSPQPAPSERYGPGHGAYDALVDPQLFDQRQQHLTPNGVQQKSQTASFFQTALNTTSSSQAAPQQEPYSAPTHPGQYSGPPLAPAPAPRPAPGPDVYPGRTPFSNPSGGDNPQLPPLRPNPSQASGPLMHTVQTGIQHAVLAPNDQVAHYPPPPPHHLDHAYMMEYGPERQGPMAVEPGQHPGLAPQPVMIAPQPHALQYGLQQPYPQLPQVAPYPPPPQYDVPVHGSQGPILQSPPPPQHVSPSPGRRSGSMSSNSRNKAYREIKPAPRIADAWENNGSELRTVQYNPQEGIRDYPATVPPPSHGPTQIRGWTHTTGSKKSRKSESSVDFEDKK